MEQINMRPAAYLTNKKTTLDIMNLPAKFGRNDNAVDVYYFHESISREHCLFECINRRITIRDLNSTVGTFINGVRLEPNVPYNIDEGMKLTFGKVKFVFHVDYEELERRESSHEPVCAPSEPRMETGAPASQRAGGKKRVRISVKELSEYEYDESEVVMIDCGLSPEEKPLSYTSEIRKKELEDRYREEEESKKTQAISLAEIEEAAEPAESEEVIEESAEEIVEENAEEVIEESAEEIVEENAEEVIEESAEEIVEENAEEVTEESAEEIIEESTEKTEEAAKEAAGRGLVLRWVDEETGNSQKLSIDYFPFRIGRKSDDNDYAIRKKGVSRTHLIIDRKGGEFFVIDDDSTNGVKVNGKKIEPGTEVRITEGDSIRIAGIKFGVREG